MKLDLKAIQTELDNLVNPILTDKEGELIPRRKDAYIKVLVKTDLQMEYRWGLDERDKSYTIRLNHRRIKNQAQLDGILTIIRKDIGGA